ncbi:histidine kinase [uncultured Tenacibaculum sp.]|uniref:sensor histidine kinase n=1 Tax=uncultured Tenacibaculum sp. TaxID=174713 RepID=UPI0026198A63|nr:histidine kinase [uncultured Tenacibaculum sp.]
MAFRKVNKSVIVSISLIISVLLNFPRYIELFKASRIYENQGVLVSLKEIGVKLLFLFIASILVLQLNANWRYRFKKVSLLVEIIITILIHIIIYFCFIKFFLIAYALIVGNKPIEVGFIYFGYGIAFLILFFIAKILRYQVIHNEVLLEKEVLRRRSIQNELMALKNQINPHFLFNSLNSLNSLIRENEKATMFVNNLSFMYRYILQSGDTEMVTLEKELEFLQSYIYLIEVRYRDRVRVTINIDEKWFTYTIPILSLQLLVENAVKHNEISEECPLYINIYIKEDYLVIENRFKPRRTLVSSTRKSLENINKRYSLLKDKRIVINKTKEKFTVKLPLN